MWGGVLANWKVRLGLGVFAGFVLIAILGPWINESILGIDPRAVDYGELGSPPGVTHLLGTTSTGQDVLAQVIAGTRGSIVVGVVAAVLGTVLAVLFGVTAGYFGGTVDHILGFVTNLFIVMPVFPLILVIAGYVQGTGPMTIAIIIGLFGWAGGARVLRAQTLSLRNRDFVVAMRVLGEHRHRLIFVEVFPHLSGLVSAMFLHGVIGGVLSEAGLAFLGVSSADSLSWGTMIDQAQQQNAIITGMWWWFVPPGLCIAAIGTAAGLANFGIDEIANPRLRTGRRIGRQSGQRPARHLAKATEG